MSSNLIGKTLLNQFKVEAFVASGGMGAVYRVRDLKRSVPLAMKVLHAALADDPSIFKRFQREARALQKLAHPNIVPFYGLYEAQDFYFLVERYVDGPSLKQALRRQKGKPLPIGETLTYLKALCAALGYAHTNGVIHCDVKPGNVMIDRNGSIYLTDFGIARHAESTETTLGAVGSPAYMAPEQVRGEAVTPATDVYAIGVILFEMLTGRRPFRSDESSPSSSDSKNTTGSERIRMAQISQPAPDPRTFEPGLSGALAQVVLKCLEKDPRKRFQSTIAVLDAVCQATGVNESSISDTIHITVDEEDGELSSSDSSVPKKSINYWLIAGAAVAVIIFFIFINSAGKGGSDRFESTLPGYQSSETVEVDTSANIQSEKGDGSESASIEEEPVQHLPAPAEEFEPTEEPEPTDTTEKRYCSGAKPSRVSVGNRAVVCTREDHLILRQEPNKSGTEIIRIVTGSLITILNGPECGNGFTWWYIESEDGDRGWVREGSDEVDPYFICPVH